MNFNCVFNALITCTQMVEEAVLQKGINPLLPEVQKILHEYDAISPEQRGRNYKDEGNRAFKELDYGQAGVHYTQAIQCILSITNELSAGMKDVICSGTLRPAPPSSL